MSHTRKIQLVRALSWFFYCVLVLLPIFYLLGSQLFFSSGDSSFDFSALFSDRITGLLIDSILLAFLVAILAIFVSLSAGLIVFTKGRKLLKELKWILLFFAVAPNFVLASIWLDIFSLFKLTSLGFFASFWVQMLALLPLALLLIIHGYESIDRNIIDAARTLGKDKRILYRIVWPAIRPFAISAFGIIFVFSILDYTIPTIFQYPVYSLEILEEYASSGEFFIPVLKSVILILITLPLILLSSSRFISQIPVIKREVGNTGQIFKANIGLQIISLFTLLILISVLLFPILISMSRSGIFSDIGETLRKHGNLILGSISNAFISAGIAMLMAYLLVISNSLSRISGWALILLPLCIPPAMTGLALQGFWNHDIFMNIYGSDFMLVFVNLSRFGPIAVLILYVFNRQIAKEQKESSRIYQTTYFHRIFQIDVPQLLPGILTSFLIVFILSVGEVGASISVIPPGGETLSIRIFNYLHYGAGETVNSLALSIFLLLVICYLLHLFGRKFIINQVR